MTVEAIRGQPGLARPARARGRRGPGRASSSGSFAAVFRPAAAWSIHDLACGSGAMGRWLAPLLPGPQHWVLHDRDADLLALAAADLPGAAATGASPSRRGCPTSPGSARTSWPARRLITASALLDLLTRGRAGRG